MDLLKSDIGFLRMFFRPARQRCRQANARQYDYTAGRKTVRKNMGIFKWVDYIVIVYFLKQTRILISSYGLKSIVMVLSRMGNTVPMVRSFKSTNSMLSLIGK